MILLTLLTFQMLLIPILSRLEKILRIKYQISKVDPVSYILPTNTIFSFEEIGLCTVNRLFKSINVNKATGPDNIPGRLLKIAADILSPLLAKIFNRSLSKGIYPSDWFYLSLKMAKM